MATFPDCMQTGAPAVADRRARAARPAPEGEQLAPTWQLTHDPVDAADLVRSAAGPRGDQLSGVVADRRSRRAGERPLVTGVRRARSRRRPGKPRNRPPRQTIPLPQDMPFGCSPAAVQTDVPVVQEVAPVRHGLARQGTAAAGRARDAGAGGADLVRPAHGPVSLRLPGVGAGLDPFRAGRLTDVTGVGERARSAPDASGDVGAPPVRLVSATRAGATSASGGDEAARPAAAVQTARTAGVRAAVRHERKLAETASEPRAPHHHHRHQQPSSQHRVS